MLWKLVSFYALHPLRIKQLFAVRKFRKVRELWDRPASSESLEYHCLWYNIVAHATWNGVALALYYLTR